MLILRKNAVELVQNAVISFALTVLAIRIYMDVTPVKILVVGNFHVAHMLWGGIFLFIACLLMFIFHNRKIMTLSSYLSGIGFGYFIDEIGKFVSLNNDYYYKLAAPLIYLTFLITVFLLFFLKKKHKPSLFAYLYYAVDDIKGILENRVLASDFTQMKNTLKAATKSDDPLWRSLGGQLLPLLNLAKKQVVADQDGLIVSYRKKVQHVGRELFARATVRIIFYLLFIIRIFWVFPSVILPSLGFSDDINLKFMKDYLITNALISGHREFYPFLFTVMLEILVGMGLLFGLGLLSLGRPRGLWLVRRLLLFSILVLGIFNIYFGQFSAVISIMIDTGLLFIITKLHQKRF